MRSRDVSWCAVVALAWLGAATVTIAQDCTLTEQARVTGGDFPPNTTHMGQSVAMDGPNMMIGSLKSSALGDQRQCRILTYDANIRDSHLFLPVLACFFRTPD